MTDFTSLLLLFVLAFITGFAFQKGNICSVLAAREIVQTGKWVRLRGLLLTSAWAFFVLVPVVWLGIGPFEFSAEFNPGVVTVFAGLFYALGCYLTGACIFGICSRTTAGHISFAFAIPSMAVGASVGQQLGVSPSAVSKTVAVSSEPGLFVGLLWACVCVWLCWSVGRLLILHSRAGTTLQGLLFHARWRSALAAMIIGVLGALMFATQVAWFYPAAVKRVFVYAIGLSQVVPIDSIVGGLSVYVGGLAAAFMRGRVVYRPPHLIPTMQALIGGFIIGFAWALIPGGNDSMVLYLLPSLALNGIVAYAVMFGTLIGLEYLKMKGRL